jgi:hypothetical protein
LPILEFVDTSFLERYLSAIWEVWESSHFLELFVNILLIFCTLLNILTNSGGLTLSAMSDERDLPPEMSVILAFGTVNGKLRYTLAVRY